MSIAGRVTLSLLNNDFHNDTQQPFEKPWHAELFATTVYLCDTHVFSWSEWTDCFSTQIQLAGKTRNIDGSDYYYEIWLQTLIVLMTAKNITNAEAVGVMHNRLIEAFEKTPHGKPLRF